MDRFSVLETIQPGATKTVLILPSYTRRQVTIDTMYLRGLDGSVSGTLTAGYSTSISAGLFEGVLTMPLDANMVYEKVLAKPSDLPRFAYIEVTNTGATPLELGGFVIVSWKPTR